jgi:flagellar export protein FliJ
MMTDRLQTLIRLRRWQLDERRRALAEIDRCLNDLNGEIDALSREMAEEQRAADAIPAEWAGDYGLYAAAALDRRRRIDGAIDSAEADRDAENGRLQAAFSETKTLELALKERRRREREEEARRERMVLDDMASVRALRQRQNP